MKNGLLDYHKIIELLAFTLWEAGLSDEPIVNWLEAERIVLGDVCA